MAKITHLTDFYNLGEDLRMFNQEKKKHFVIIASVSQYQLTILC